MLKSKFYNLDTDTTLSENSDLYIPSQKATKTYIDTIANTKQDTLVSGTNIKTINDESILGSGNIDIQGGGSVDCDDKSITKNISDEIQTVGVIDSNDNTKAIKTWTGTQAQYANLFGFNWDTATINQNLTNMNCLAYDGTKFVALSYDGYISTSTDGTTWSTAIKISNLGNREWCTITYGDGKFVAIGALSEEDTYISTSTDGTTWTVATIDSNLNNQDYLYALCYGNGKFIAISYSGYVSTSINGTTWSQSIQVSNLGDNEWKSVVWDGTKYIALGYSGYISTSTDGINWIVATQNNDLGSNSWCKLIYDGVKCVAFGGWDYGYISTSTDGITWTAATYDDKLSVGDDPWKDMAYGQNKFVIIGGVGYVSTSEVSIDQNTLYNVVENGLYLGQNKIASYSSGSGSVSYDDKSITENSSNELQVVGVINSRDDTTALKLWTGTKAQYDAFFSLTWSNATSVATLANKTWCYPVWNGTKFVMIGSGGVAAISTDGITWTIPTQTSNVLGSVPDKMTYGAGKFICVYDVSSEYTEYLFVSSDGINWTEVYDSSETGLSYPVLGLTYGNGKFIATYLNGYYATSTDGIHWTESSSHLQIEESPITFGDGKFVTLNYYGEISTSTDGETWTAATKVLDDSSYVWENITYDGTKFVAISEYGYISTSIDGITWTTPTQINQSTELSWYNLSQGGNRVIAMSITGSEGQETVYTSVSTSVDALDNNTLYNILDYGITLGSNKIASNPNNGKLIMSRNGTAVATFEADDSDDVYVDVGGGSSYTAGTGIDITNNVVSVTSPTIVSNTDQDITGIKTFIGEKKIHFKQSAAADKLGFTLFDNSNGELAAFEYRPNTISGNALMNINTSQSGTTWLGFRYWANINIVAPKPSNGTYYIPVNITNGTTTVTANNTGTVNVSTLIPTVNNPTITITQGGVTKGSFTLNQATGDTIALDAGGGSSTWSYDSATKTLTIS